MSDLESIWNQLWPAVNSGSESAMAELMKKTYRRYRWYAFRIVKHWDDADDAVQSAFWKLWQKRKTIHGNPAAWFYMTLRNRCIDLERRRQRRKRLLEDIRQTPTLPPGDPAAAIDFWRLWDRLSGHLGTQQQEVFWMKEILGMNDDTIARLLSISESTVRSHLSLARKRLREQYRRLFQEDALNPSGEGGS